MARGFKKQTLWAAGLAAGAAVVVVLAVVGSHRGAVPGRTVAAAQSAALAQAARENAAADALAAEPLAVFLGDSYTAGTGASSPDKRWTTLLATAEHWREFNAGEGSTGFVNPGQNAGEQAFPDRVAGVIAQHPSIVVVAGGLNDLTAADQPRWTAATTATYQAIRHGLPNATIIAVGPSYPSATPSAAVRELDADVRSAAAAVNADYVSLLNPDVFAAPGLLYVDKVHPNDAGHQAIFGQIKAHLPPTLG